ncbi:MAG TPA: N-acetylmuramoyl-L-alanine amidase [Anaerolineaceae bacterium]|nr:N-acetylmuramoyl-L-alanine amidase [Anaerolineaceae bacterium]HPN51855.1 N-acetylmuramoyl-L-alanine amidase [Anaerolineaceae bacterium]
MKADLGRKGWILMALLALLWLAACTPAAAGEATPCPACATPEPAATCPAEPVSTPSPCAAPTLQASPTPTLPAAVPAGAGPLVPLALAYRSLNDSENGQTMMTPAWFREQLTWLADNGFTALDEPALLDLLKGKPPMAERPVIITIDLDRPWRKMFYDEVIPTLRNTGLHALVFLTVRDSVVGKECDDKSDRFCWKELTNWEREGLITLGSMGMGPSDYRGLTPADLQSELAAARKVMAGQLGHAVNGFSYPTDTVSEKLGGLVHGAGYSYGFGLTTRSDLLLKAGEANAYLLPRFYPAASPAFYPVLHGTQGRSFAGFMLNQAERSALPVPAATPMPSPTTTPEPLQKLADYCKRPQRANDPEWLAGLDAMAFPTDLSLQAVVDLPRSLSVRPSCNFVRNNEPKAIVVHYTDGDLTGSIATFQQPKYTSIHYIIDRSGAVVQMVPEELGAMHVSCYGYRTGCRESCPICDLPNGRMIEPYQQSIGIELVNTGPILYPEDFNGPIYEDYLNAFRYRFWEEYPPAQLAALRVLVADIRARWNLPLEAVMGHYRINDKPDPGPALNLLWPRVGNPPAPAILGEP